MKGILAFLFFAAGVLFASEGSSAQLINITGNGVELTYVDVDCSNENEIGIAVSGTDFVGQQISVQNCAAGGFKFDESATLKNSLAISTGDDITIAVDKTVAGTYNLFGDAAKAGAGTYSDAGTTSLWGAAYSARINAAEVIESLHSGTTIIGGDACGNTRLQGLPDIGGCEWLSAAKSWMQLGLSLSLH